MLFGSIGASSTSSGLYSSSRDEVAVLVVLVVMAAVMAARYVVFWVNQARKVI